MMSFSDKDAKNLKNIMIWVPILTVVGNVLISLGGVSESVKKIDQKIDKTEFDIKCNAIQDKTESDIKNVDEKLNLIINNQNELIKRFDRHIDKDK